MGKVNGTVPAWAPFQTAVIDPPWPYQQVRSSDRKLYGYASYTEQADRHQYHLLSIADLAALPVANAVSGYLFLWCPGPFLGDGFKLIDAWGFNYVTALHWLKRTQNGKILYGAGYWYRGAVETVLLARKSGTKAIRTQQRNVFEAVRRNHSAKPEEFQDHVEQFFPGPYLELFARRQRPGWTCLGDESPGDGEDIRKSLPLLINRSRKRRPFVAEITTTG